ncbi:hypothetical protein C0580_00360 [Candidatus Parcubacteria bacterium]|mgnify:CR=1 FL=1|nr:MAG: hypothetical protein C0580_00360 [Candidatus Parcubacteria bacterium]
MNFLNKVKDYFKSLKKVDDYLALVGKLLLIVILFAPLVTGDNFYFPYIVPRNLMFRMIINLLFGIYLWLWLINPRYRFRFNKGLVILFLFISSLTVSSIIGYDFGFSFWSNFERMDGLVNWYYIFIYIFVLLGLVRDKKDWHLLFNFSLIPAFIISAIAIGQRLEISFISESHGGIRATSTLGNAAYVGSYMFLHSALAFYLMIIRYLKKRSWSWLYLWYGLNIILFVSALVVSQTRGAFLGLAAFSFLLAIFYLWFNRKKKNKVYYGVALLIILVLSFAALVYQQKGSAWVKDSLFLNKFASMSLQDTTVHSRWHIWSSSLASVKEKPLLGWGEEGFRYVFSQYFPPEIYRQVGSEIWFDRPHNALLQYLIQGGIIGFVLYLAIFAYLIFYLYKKSKKQKEWFFSFFWIAFLLAYLFHNLFIFDSLNINITIYLILAYLFSLGIKKKWRLPSVLHNRQKYYVYIPLIVLLVGTLTYTMIWRPYKANTLLLQASKMVAEARTRSDYNIALSKWEQSVESSSLGNREKAEVLSRMTTGILSNPYVSDSIKEKYFTRTEDFLEEMYYDNPEDVRLGLFLSYFYQRATGLDPNYAVENIGLLNTIKDIAPKRPDVVNQLSTAYLVVGDFDAARQEARELTAIVPWAKIGYWTSFNVDLYSGNADSLRNNLQEIVRINQEKYNIDFEDQEIERLRLIMTQAEANQDEPIIEVLKEFLP